MRTEQWLANRNFFDFPAMEVKLTKKKTTSSKAIKEALARQQHMAVREWLNQEPTYSNLLSNLVEEKGEGNESTLLEVLLKSKKPISAKNIGMPKATVSKAAKELNKYLTNKFSKSIEPLYSRRIVICISHKEGRGGLFTGYHFKCYNKKTERDLDGPATEKLFENLWDNFIQDRLREKLEEDARYWLSQKLKGRDDYQSLSMEIGVIEKKLQQDGINGLTGAEKLKTYDHNRAWKSFNQESLLELGGAYILTVDAGGGKTTFLRHLQIEVLQKTRLIPIFLDASEIEQWNPKNTRKFAKNLTEKFDLKVHEDKVIGFLTQAIGKDIILLVDGLDQIRVGGNEYEKLANHILDDLVKSNIIIASRPSAVLNLEDEQRFTFLRLEPFNENTQEKYFGEYYKRAKELSINAPDLVAIPMLAYMVRTLIEEEEDKDIKTRTELYEKFIGYILKRYKHGKSRLDPDVRTQIRQSLRRISYDALAQKEPHIQKIPLKFCYEKGRLPDEPTVRKGEFLTKSGLVNLILERSGEGDKDFLFFTHQSFQEYLAAKCAEEDEIKINHILDEIWNPKWKEVVKFLAGYIGEDFVKKIYQPGCKDNCIHSHLLEAAECCRELGCPTEIESFLLSELLKLMREPPFISPAVFGISSLNKSEAGDMLLDCVEGKNIEPTYLYKGEIEEKAAQAMENLAGKITENQKARFLRFLMVTPFQLPCGLYMSFKKLAQKGILNSDDIDWLINNYVKGVIPFEHFQIFDLLCENITSSNVDRALQFFECRGDGRQIASAYLLLERFARYGKLEDKHIQTLFDLLDARVPMDKTHILKVLAELKDAKKLSPEYVGKVINLLDSNNADIRQNAVNALRHWAGSQDSVSFSRYPFSDIQIIKIASLMQHLQIDTKNGALSVLREIINNQFTQGASALLNRLSESGKEFQFAIIACVFDSAVRQKNRQITYSCIQHHIQKILYLLRSTDKQLRQIVFEFIYYYRYELFTKNPKLISAALDSSEVILPDISLSTYTSPWEFPNLTVFLESSAEFYQRMAIRMLQREPRENLKPYIDKIIRLLLGKNPQITKDCIQLLRPVARELCNDHIIAIIDCLASEYFEVQIASFDLLDSQYGDTIKFDQTAKLLSYLQGEWGAVSFFACMLLLNTPERLNRNIILSILKLLGKQDDYILKILSLIKKESIGWYEYVELATSMLRIRSTVSLLPFFMTFLNEYSRDEIQKIARLFDAISFSAVSIDGKINKLMCHILEKFSNDDINEIVNIYLHNPASERLTKVIQHIPEELLLQRIESFFSMLEHIDQQARLNVLSILEKHFNSFDIPHIEKVVYSLADSDLGVSSKAYQLLQRIYESGRCVLPFLKPRMNISTTI